MATEAQTRHYGTISLDHNISSDRIGEDPDRGWKIAKLIGLIAISIFVVPLIFTWNPIVEIWTDLNKGEGLPATYTPLSGEINPTHHDSISTPGIHERRELHIEVNALHQEVLELDNPREREIPAMTDDMDIDGLNNLRSGLIRLKSRITRDQAKHELFIEVNELRQGILELDNPENRPIPPVTNSMSADELVALRGELTRLREFIIQDQEIKQLKDMLGQSRVALEDAKLEFTQMSEDALEEFEKKAVERKQELSPSIDKLTREWHELSQKEKRLEAFQSGASGALEAMREKVKSLGEEKKALTQQYKEISEADDLREIAAKKLGLRKKTSKETLKEKRETVEQHQSALRDQIESHWKYMHSIPEQIREIQRARSRINQQLDPLRAEVTQIDDQRYNQRSSNGANLRKFNAFIARIDELEQEVLRVENLSLNERSNAFSGTQGIDHKVRGLLNVDVRDFVRDLKWLAVEHISRFLSA